MLEQIVFKEDLGSVQTTDNILLIVDFRPMQTTDNHNRKLGIFTGKFLEYKALMVSKYSITSITIALSESYIQKDKIRKAI